MIERQFHIGFATFPYGGNGSLSSEVPELKHWWAKTRMAIEKDDRIAKPVWTFDRADTPITMVRNMAAKAALHDGLDALVMYDSDMVPDLLLGTDPEAKPFWDVALDLFCKHYDKGPCIIGAPYCGGPPHPVVGGSEVPFVFTWRNDSNHADCRWPKLKLFEREEVAHRAGIERVPAIGTGIILIDMRVFKELPPPWFEYEYGDPPFNTYKASTEDVYFTRNASMNGIPVFVTWDCWAGHTKPYVVGKPWAITDEEVREPYRQAVLRGLSADDKLVDFNADKTEEEVLSVGRNGHGRPPVPEYPQIEAVPMPVFVDVLPDGFLRVGWASSQEDYEHMLAALQPIRNRVESTGTQARIVEIGSWVGESAVRIHDSFPEGMCEVICVDTWEGDPDETQGEIIRRFGGANKMLATFLRNVGNRNIHAIRAESAEAGRRWPAGRKLDAVWIDGGHSYQQVKADILAWLPHVALGGVICGHDHSGTFPGVIRAVKELIGDVTVRGTVWSAPVTQELLDRVATRREMEGDTTTERELAAVQ